MADGNDPLGILTDKAAPQGNDPLGILGKPVKKKDSPEKAGGEDSEGGSKKTQPTSGSKSFHQLGKIGAPELSTQAEPEKPETVTVGGKEFEVGGETIPMTSGELESQSKKLFKTASPVKVNLAPQITSDDIKGISPKIAKGNEDILKQYVSQRPIQDQNKIKGSTLTDEQSLQLLYDATTPIFNNIDRDVKIYMDRGVGNDLNVIKKIDDELKTIEFYAKQDIGNLQLLQERWKNQKGVAATSSPEFQAEQAALTAKINENVDLFNSIKAQRDQFLTPERVSNIEGFKLALDKRNELLGKLNQAENKLPEVMQKKAGVDAIATLKDFSEVQGYDLAAKTYNGFISSVGKIASAIPAMAGNLSPEYSVSDKAAESISEFFAPPFLTSETKVAGQTSDKFKPFYDSQSDSINWSALPDELANQAGAFAVLAATGAMGNVAKLGDAASIVLPGTLLSYEDAYKTGKEIYKDNPSHANAYALASSFITGITEMIMPDRDIVSGSIAQKLSKTFVEDYAKAGKNVAMKRMTKNLLEMAGKEAGEELIDRWKDVVLAGVANVTGGEADYDIPSINENLSIIASTVALTGIAGGRGAVQNTKRMRDLTLYEAAQNYPQTMTTLSNLQAEGFDPDRLEQVKAEVTDTYLALRKIPTTLSIPKKTAIVKSLAEIEELRQINATGIDPTIIEVNNKRIKAVQGEIENIINDPKFDETFQEEVEKEMEMVVPQEEGVETEAEVTEPQAPAIEATETPATETPSEVATETEIIEPIINSQTNQPADEQEIQTTQEELLETESIAEIPEEPVDSAVTLETDSQKATAEAPAVAEPEVATEPIEIPMGELEGEVKERGGFRQYKNDPSVSFIEKGAVPKYAQEYIVQVNKLSEGAAREFISKYGTQVAISAYYDKNNGMNGGVRSKLATVLIKSLDAKGLVDEANAIRADYFRDLTDAGQFGQAALAMQEVEPQYDLQESIMQYEAVSGKPISEAKRFEFEQIARKYKKIKADYDKLKQDFNDKIEAAALANIRESIKREKQSPEERKEVLRKEKKARKEELRKEFAGIFNDFTNIPALLVNERFLEYNKLVIEEVAGDFARFVRKIVKELGIGVKPYARQIFKAAGGELPKPTFDEETNRLIISPQLIRSIVEEGVKDFNELAQKVYDIVVEDLPGIEMRDVKDAVSGYGKIANQSKDNLEAEIRQLKRDGRLLAAYEDAVAGKGVKRSGLQREKPTDWQRDMLRKINDILKLYPQDQQAIEKKWKSALDRAKSHLKNRIADIDKRIKDIEAGIAEPLPSKKRGFELDQEAKDLTETKNTLQKRLLELEPKQGISDEQRLKVAIAAAQRNLNDLNDRIKKGDLSFAQKVQATPSSPELLALKEQVKHQKEVLKQMREEAGVAEQHRIDLYKKRISERTRKIEKQIAEKDFAPRVKKEIPMDEEILKLRAKLDQVKFERDVEIEKEALKNRSTYAKWADGTANVLSGTKSLMATMDLSAPMRQGFVLSVNHPMMATRAFGEQFKSWWSSRNFELLEAKIKESDAYPFMRQAKLYLSDPTAALKAREEDFASTWPSRIPFYGKFVKKSERAYTAYLNSIRADAFMQFMEGLKADGITGKEFENELASYAKFINNATGRGNMNEMAERIAPLLNSAYFSPRYVTSRINLVANPVWWINMSPRARIQAAKSMGIYFGVMATTLALAAGGDDDDVTVELDPRSSDFAKIKIGDTRYDLLAGFQQAIVLASRIATNKTKSTKTGKLKELGEGYKADDVFDVMLKFSRTKASPMVASAINLRKGEDMVGNPVTLQGEALKMILPMYSAEIIENLQSDSVDAKKLIIDTAWSMMGVGVQTYDK